MNKTELKKFTQLKIMAERPEDYSKVTGKLLNRAMDYSEGIVDGIDFSQENYESDDEIKKPELLELTYNWIIRKIQ